MKNRQSLIAIAAVATATTAAAGAQPDKDVPHSKALAPATTAPVVLASASDLRRPSKTDTEPRTAPVRRPAPRVTTCRCGDPQPDDNQLEQ